VVGLGVVLVVLGGGVVVTVVVTPAACTGAGSGAAVPASCVPHPATRAAPNARTTARRRTPTSPPSAVTRFGEQTTHVPIRPRRSADKPLVAEFLDGHNALHAARLGRLEHAPDHPALLALDDAGTLLGVLTYIPGGTSWEVLTLHTAERHRGTGTALLAAVERLAADAGATRLWLITTNDNVDALRFYQRRGFHLAALHPGAVDHSRAALKPAIPLTGAYSIPLRDELELHKELTG
jgi:GNAT superfamily N-acetyltransferase